MRYQYILFDLDGTLTDSGEGVMNSGAYAFEQLNLPVPSRQNLGKMVGPPLGTIFPLLGVPEDKVEEAIRLYRDQYDNHGGKFQNKVYPGVEELLKRLREKGCTLYVATSKPEDVAREVLAFFGLDSYFSFIAGSTKNHSRETKRDVLNYLLGRIGREQNAVMVGDTNYDVIGANQVGLPCIGVSWGYGSTADMEEAGAEIIVDSPEMLLDYLG